MDKQAEAGAVGALDGAEVDNEGIDPGGKGALHLRVNQIERTAECHGAGQRDHRRMIRQGFDPGFQCHIGLESTLGAKSPPMANSGYSNNAEDIPSQRGAGIRYLRFQRTPSLESSIRMPLDASRLRISSARAKLRVRLAWVRSSTRDWTCSSENARLASTSGDAWSRRPSRSAHSRVKRVHSASWSSRTANTRSNSRRVSRTSARSLA